MGKLQPINLFDLFWAWKSLPDQEFIDYMSLNGIVIHPDDNPPKGGKRGLRKYEIQSLCSLIEYVFANDLFSFKPNILDGFYLGFEIRQLGKEFDAIKLGENGILNIEVKRDYPKKGKEGMRQQALRNRHYLRSLSKNVTIFTFVEKDATLYRFTFIDDDNNVEMNQTHKEDFIGALSTCGAERKEDIDELFCPFQFLVSPFNNLDKFLDNRYFLTQHQEDIKKEFLGFIKSDSSFFAITGGHGTGKTLLLYDIAKEVGQDNVVIIHCGKLNSAQEQLRAQGWHIFPPNQFPIEDHIEYLFLIDEAQRLTIPQFNSIVLYVKNNKLKCVFSYDAEQYLKKEEAEANIGHNITQLILHHHCRLSSSIRSDVAISSFIDYLTNNNRKIKERLYAPNIKIVYCSSIDRVVSLCKQLIEDDWMYINYTPPVYSHSSYSYQGYEQPGCDSAHAVIGQEFDRIVAVVDDHFHYGIDGKLTTAETDEVYDQERMFYQIVTRATKALFLIIYNNQEVLRRCIEILK